MASAPAAHAGYDQPPAYTSQPDPYSKQPQGYQGGAPAGAYVGGPPGYQPVSGQPQQQYPYTGNQPHTVIVQPHTTQVIAIVGGCPACRVGVLQDDFTCLGVCCAILFFPLGIICCMLMRQRRCPNCGAIFG